MSHIYLSPADCPSTILRGVWFFSIIQICLGTYYKLVSLSLLRGIVDEAHHMKKRCLIS